MSKMLNYSFEASWVKWVKWVKNVTGENAQCVKMAQCDCPSVTKWNSWYRWHPKNMN